MKKQIIIRFAEIHLKGKNKKFFLRTLFDNIKENLSEFDCKVDNIFNRFLVTEYNESDKNKIIHILKNTAGISSISIADSFETNLVAIENYAKSITINGSFKVKTNRADKSFEMNSSTLSAHIGGVLLDNNKNAVVNLTSPQQVLNFDLRENGTTFAFEESIQCVSGLPLDKKANGLLLLSGGIDSPVAGYMMGIRGLRQDLLHFNSYPYTSPLAKEKVITLAKKIKPYVGARKMYIVSMTKMQEQFREHCKDEYAVTLLRRNMYRVAEQLCKNAKYKSIVTGENLGQVASQTIEGLTCSSNALQTVPVFRPLIAFNKNDIINLAEKIDTFETSILPYEDCCTVFLPQKPVIKPTIHICEAEESKINIESLINFCIENMEVIEL